MVVIDFYRMVPGMFPAFCFLLRGRFSGGSTSFESRTSQDLEYTDFLGEGRFLAFLMDADWWREDEFVPYVVVQMKDVR